MYRTTSRCTRRTKCVYHNGRILIEIIIQINGIEMINYRRRCGRCSRCEEL